MTPDPKWLEILNKSGWKTLAICAACCALLILDHLKIIPPLAPWMSIAAVFGALLTGALTLVAIVSTVVGFFAPRTWLLHFIKIHRQRKAARNYIPHMQGHEKQIIAHLLHHNQKTFIGAADGGYAMPLISNGIVIMAIIAGQHYDLESTPFVVPDHIWSELKKQEDKFPYMVDGDPDNADQPWRIHWMGRI